MVSARRTGDNREMTHKPRDERSDSLGIDPLETTPMPVKPIPDGYAAVNAYLIVKGAAKALDYYTKAFGAVERMRMPMPEGRIGHCEFTIGGSVVMMADEFPEMGILGPQGSGRPPVGMAVYVPDADTVFARALAAGGKEIRPMKTQFYGDRSGTLIDPFGHLWTIATHVEDVSPEDMKARMDKECGGA
jgi:PhnB protein